MCCSAEDTFVPKFKGQKISPYQYERTKRLEKAVNDNDISEAKKLVKQGVRVDSGKSPGLLRDAISQDRPRIVQLLLDLPGVDIDHTFALHTASEHGNLNILKMVLARSNPCFLDPFGNMAFHYLGDTENHLQQAQILMADIGRLTTDMFWYMRSRHKSGKAQEFISESFEKLYKYIQKILVSHIVDVLATIVIKYL